MPTFKKDDGILADMAAEILKQTPEFKSLAESVRKGEMTIKVGGQPNV